LPISFTGFFANSFSLAQSIVVLVGTEVVRKELERMVAALETGPPKIHVCDQETDVKSLRWFRGIQYLDGW
jgi:hypothetical protein